MGFPLAGLGSDPVVLEPPAGARTRKKENSKIRGGVICGPRAQHGRKPEFLEYKYLWKREKQASKSSESLWNTKQYME